MKKCRLLKIITIAIVYICLKFYSYIKKFLVIQAIKDDMDSLDMSFWRCLKHLKVPINVIDELERIRDARIAFCHPSEPVPKLDFRFVDPAERNSIRLYLQQRSRFFITNLQ